MLYPGMEQSFKRPERITEVLLLVWEHLLLLVCPLLPPGSGTTAYRKDLLTMMTLVSHGLVSNIFDHSFWCFLTRPDSCRPHDNPES
jgi:hypothetical protein